jgi:hypothetical protein
MKKLTAFLCIIMALCLPFLSVASERLIPFGTKVENPLLTFPIDEKIIMKNGTLVIEAEDMIYDFTMAVVEDEDASKGYALKTAQSGWLEISDLKGPGFMTKILVDKQDTYVIWARIKSSALSPSYHERVSNPAVYTTRWIPTRAADSDELGEWAWVPMLGAGGSVVLKQGMQEIIFANRSDNMSYDRFIVTSNTTFTPVGKDDVPGGDGGGSYGGSIPANAYPPANVHPRVYVNADDIPKLKERINHPAIKPNYEKIVAEGMGPLDCEAPPVTQAGTHNFNVGNCSALISRAFLYLLGETGEEHARETIRQLKIFMETTVYDRSIGDITRMMGDELVAAAIVYDWCYNALMTSDKEFIIRKMYEVTEQKEMGWPPTNRNYIWGHGIEGEMFKDNLAAAIAVYDEEPSYYEITAGTMFANMIPARHFLIDSLNDPSGSSYGLSRYIYAVNADRLMRTIGYEDLFGENFSSIPHKWIYERLPNGIWFKDGDCWVPERYYIDTRFTANNTLFTYTGSTYGDPHLMGEGLLNLYWSGYGSKSIWTILFTDPEEPYSFTDGLPLTRYTNYPMTSMVARTSWQNGLNSPAAMAFMNARDVSIGDHQHSDVGSFQIYYKGLLALDSGYFQYGNHYTNYSARSIAHNVLLVDDPGEPQFKAYGSSVPSYGGQKSTYFETGWGVDKYESLTSENAKTAEEKAHYIGPNLTTPEFSYLSSDVSYAYTDKVQEYERSMVFMDLFREDYPAAFIVYDNVKSKAPELKKRWLLHSEQEPHITANGGVTTTTIRRNEEGYNGRLVNHTLIPAADKADFKTIGGSGREFEVGGVNYPITLKYPGAIHDSGQWRIELSPKVQAQEDTFLNVMYVTDDNAGHPELPAYRVYGTGFLGVTIADRVVTFSSTRGKISNSINLTVRDNGYDTMSCLITDMEEGVWNVSGGGVNTVIESKAGENVLYFRCVPGSYTISKATPGSQPQEVIYPTADKETFGDFLIRRNNNLMYLPKPTWVVDGRAYIAVDGILTQLLCTIKSKTENSVTITSGNNTITLSADTTEYIENGIVKQLTYPPKIFLGELYVDALDIAGRLSTKLMDMTYDPYLRLLKFSINMPKEIVGIDMSAVINPVKVTGTPSSIATYPLEHIHDLNTGTQYTAETPSYVLFDLGEEYNISKISIVFHVGDKRKTFFNVEISTDGESFTKVFDGESSGKTSEFEDFRIKGRARYVRFNFNGNSDSGKFDSIHEILIMK